MRRWSRTVFFADQSCKFPPSIETRFGPKTKLRRHNFGFLLSRIGLQRWGEGDFYYLTATLRTSKCGSYYVDRIKSNYTRGLLTTSVSAIMSCKPCFFSVNATMM